MVRRTRLLLAISATALAAVASGCTASDPGATRATAGSDSVTSTAAASTASTPVTSATTPASATTFASATPTTSRGTTTSSATPTTTTATPPASPSSTVVPASLAGRWGVHDATVDVRTDGTGTMSLHDCVPSIPTCTVQSDVSVRPYFGGLILTVQRTYALDQAGRPVPLTPAYDVSTNHQAPGDHSVIVPFSATDWPYDVPLTSGLQSHVDNWQLVSRGGHPSATTATSNRIIRDLDHFPAGARERDFYGA